MDPELGKLADELKNKTGLDLADLLRGTHAETVMVVASILSDTLELALRCRFLLEKKPANDRMFKQNGPLGTLQKRIDAAHKQKLIDDTARKDAHLVRLVRNKFSHSREKLHFDNAEIVALIKRMSTYETAATNQDAFLNAQGNAIDQAAQAVKALREAAAQPEATTA
jgi:DNA-binding MltR family transcriptional regulator